MGFRADERDFLRFDRYLRTLPDAAAQPLPILVDQWARAASNPAQQLHRIQVGRSVARAMGRTGHPVSLPTPDPRLLSAARQRLRRPYIYSSEEIQRLLTTARTFPSPRSPLRQRTLYTMLILAYCLGLRLGELVNLKLQDVNLAEPWLDIRESKFFKSRRLPLPTSVARELEGYLKARQQVGASDAPDSPLFWHEQGCRGYSRGGAYWLLLCVLRRAGLKGPAGRIGPRPHDLRHAFVVHRLTQWYKEGIDPQPRLPYLATYLGHKDIHSTLVYLTATHQLLTQANERFHRIGARLLASTCGEEQCN